MNHLQIHMKLPSINFHKIPFSTYRFNQQTAKHNNDNNANFCNISLQMYQGENKRKKHLIKQWMLQKNQMQLNEIKRTIITYLHITKSHKT